MRHEVWQMFGCFDTLSRAPRRLESISGLHFLIGDMVVALGPKVALDPKVRRALLTWRKTHFFLGEAKSARKVWQIFRCFDTLSRAPRRPSSISGLHSLIGDMVVALGPKVARRTFHLLTKQKVRRKCAKGVADI